MCRSEEVPVRTSRAYRHLLEAVIIYLSGGLDEDCTEPCLPGDAEEEKEYATRCSTDDMVDNMVDNMVDKAVSVLQQLIRCDVIADMGKPACDRCNISLAMGCFALTTAPPATVHLCVPCGLHRLLDNPSERQRWSLHRLSSIHSLQRLKDEIRGVSHSAMEAVKLDGCMDDALFKVKMPQSFLGPLGGAPVLHVSALEAERRQLSRTLETEGTLTYANPLAAKRVGSCLGSDDGSGNALGDIMLRIRNTKYFGGGSPWWPSHGTTTDPFRATQLHMSENATGIPILVWDTTNVYQFRHRSMHPRTVSS